MLTGWYTPPAPVPPPPAPVTPPRRRRLRPEAAPEARCHRRAAAEPADEHTDDQPDEEHWRRSAARVNIGGDITIEADERVSDPVVAVGGSVTVLGHVDDDVVAVGGSVHLGPKAVVRGDVTSVGGRIEQSHGAVIRGHVNEIRFGPPNFHFHPGIFLGPLVGWDMFSGWFRLVGTLLRLGIVLILVFMAVLAAPRVVERIGERAAREPWMSGFTGLLAQLLFVPVLVLSVVVLAVSIIGIPLARARAVRHPRLPAGRADRIHGSRPEARTVGRRAGAPGLRHAGRRRHHRRRGWSARAHLRPDPRAALADYLVPRRHRILCRVRRVDGRSRRGVADAFGTRGPRPVMPAPNDYPPPIPAMSGPSEA